MDIKKYFKRDIRDTLPFLCIEAYLLLQAGGWGGSYLLRFADSALARIWPNILDNSVWITASDYGSFAVIWGVLLLWMYIFKKNRPLLKMLWVDMPGNTVKNLLLGLGVGFALNGLCAAVACLNNDIVLYFDSFRPISFVIVFITVFIQSSSEEVLCRCFLYGRLRMSYKHPAVAIIGNAMLFSLMHLLNPSVSAGALINIMGFGILFSLIVYYTQSLWCAFAMHAAWNFTQTILLGLPNSGLVSPYSVFKLEAASARSSFAYDVGFGIEGTIMSNVVLTAACIVIYVWGSKKKKAEAAF